ncbi:hypothetical protein [Neisseria iguanae]|uniref:Uncharacterized protein n=1 Tax=Neisseria iguanae TaxID=90242 RepID=A0A2P7TXB4_9NEIS|nr:hypothetical protein C7N83_12570 [Neisseria iguanae]
MGRFFKQTAEAVIAKHTGRFPLLKSHIITGRQPITNYPEQQKAVMPVITAAVPFVHDCPCPTPFYPAVSDPGHSPVTRIRLLTLLQF